MNKGNNLGELSPMENLPPFCLRVSADKFHQCIEQAVANLLLCLLVFHERLLEWGRCTCMYMQANSCKCKISVDSQFTSVSH